MLVKKTYHQERLVRDTEGNLVGHIDDSGQIRLRAGLAAADAGVDAASVSNEPADFSTVVKNVKIGRAKHNQCFSPSMLERGDREGWVTRGGGKITIGNDPKEAVVYKIVRTPGLYCCHCNKEMDDSLSAQEHVATAHKDAKARSMTDKGGRTWTTTSPDANNPAGYRQDNFYACELVSAPEHAVHKRRTLVAGAAAALGAIAANLLGVDAEQVAAALGLAAFGLFGANFVFNISAGRFVELYNRVDTNDPTNSVLLVALIAASGVESDATLKDKDTFTDLVSGATDFATNTNGTRKSLTDSDIVSFAPDDTNDRTDVDIPDQTWTALANDGTGAVSDIVIGYDNDSTGGTDANVIPMTFHDFSVTPDGSDVTAQIAAAGFARATPV